MSIVEEVHIFESAIWSGVFLYSLYYAIGILRNMKKHSLWLINLEDVVYWAVAGSYLFVQIDDTNNGAIRGYYVLGIVLGSLLTWKIFRTILKLWKKFVHFRKEKKVE